ncbi:MAG: glycerol-3-phosphate 1-O-acyltransferase PlsY [Terriglobales bacterium]
MAIYAIVAVLAYLLGSIPFGLILTRVFLHQDVRQIGSGNIGATNVMRTGSKGLGIATLLLDAAKGYAAVMVAYQVSASDWNYLIRPTAHYSVNALVLASIAAMCAIMGHVFPVWLKFIGGKGVATGVGAFIALAPKAVLIVLVIFAALLAAFRYVSLGSIVATAAFPIVASLLPAYRENVAVLPFMYAAAVLIIAKHHQNIRRLLSGTEHRLEFKHR